MKDTTPQAVQAAHELLLWLIPRIDKFPRVADFDPNRAKNFHGS